MSYRHLTIWRGARIVSLAMTASQRPLLCMIIACSLVGANPSTPTHQRQISMNPVEIDISQIPQRIIQLSHNAPFCNRNVHTCAHFCYKMMHCEIWGWRIVEFVQQGYSDTLKPHRCHDANFVIPGGTRGFHNDILQCCWWRQSCIITALRFQSDGRHKIYTRTSGRWHLK